MSTLTTTRRTSNLPGLLVTAAGIAAALGVHRLVPQVGTLTWSVILGAAAANLNLLPEATRSGLRVATKMLLRIGVVLLGFSLSLVSIVGLGGPVIALVVVTLFSTLAATTWAGVRMGVGRPRSLLVATGFAICGASAIAAMEEHAEGDEDDVATAIAMVTICGTVAMIVLPFLQAPLGLTDTQFGAWAGASVHEVGQVVATASAAGPAALGVAVVVKLTRVLMLAPVVAGVSLLRRRRLRTAQPTKLPPLVPLFVIGFLACVGLRSTGVVPDPVLAVLEQLQTLTLGAALFGMGTGVHVASLVRSSGRATVLAALSTLVVACIALGGVLLLSAGYSTSAASRASDSRQSVSLSTLETPAGRPSCGVRSGGDARGSSS
ncbi:MAG TPA: putative sulfate exporter family transporter [Nocardioidaceae bacterium]|nr:putative sulfate exporter family transporter [Nocardioidaceae bacterium]